LAAACHASANRCRFAATLPLPRIDEALAELERVAALPGFHAVSLSTHLEGAPIDDERFVPVLAALDAAGRQSFSIPTASALPESRTTT
jgi:predicted TIM-barrel fold metal-dependent hydrolase